MVNITRSLLSANAGKRWVPIKKVITVRSLRVPGPGLGPWSPHSFKGSSSSTQQQHCQHSQKPAGTHNYLVFGWPSPLILAMMKLEPELSVKPQDQQCSRSHIEDGLYCSFCRQLTDSPVRPHSSVQFTALCTQKNKTTFTALGFENTAYYYT